MANNTKQGLKQFLTKVQKDLDDAKPAATKVKGADERKNVLNLKILCVVDVSGSISKEQYNSFMNQLQKVRGLSMVKVIETDTDIVAVYDYYAGNHNKVIKLGGGGGTDFQEAFKWAKNAKPDAVLCLTDGDECGHVPKPNYPVGWVTTAAGCAPYDWGIEITKVDK